MHSHDKPKVDKADIHSLEQVWGRLEEHIERNSTAYENNRNVPALHKTLATSGVKKDQHNLALQKQHTFQQRLGTIAAVFFVVVLVGSLLLVLQAVHHANTLTGAHGSTQRTTAPSKGPIPLKQVVSIITQKNGADQFNPAKLVVPVGGTVVWYNQTTALQVVLPTNNVPGIKLQPGEYKAMTFNQAGVCILHLQSNSSIQIAVIVGKGLPPTTAINTCDVQTGKTSS